MRCLSRITFAGSIFLVMAEGFSNGSSAAMAQQHWIACAAARTSPNGAQTEQAIVAKKEDALVLADLKEEAVLLPSLVDEYTQKVKRAQLEASAAWELFARELEKRVLHVTGEAELRTSIERLIRCSDGLERDTQAAKLGSLSELRMSRSQWNHEQYFVALAALVPLFKEDIERRPKRLGIWMSRAFSPSERFLPHRMRMNPYSWEGIVLAGIDSYQDERAARFLLDYALRPSKANAVDTMAQWALVFLRAYHPAVVKPAIAAALEEEKRKGGDWEWSPSFLTRPSRAFLLQDCLASLEIAESLPPEELVLRHRIILG